MNEQNNISNVQLIKIFDRKKIEIKGVVEVYSSSDKEIYVRLEKSGLIILGEKMTINKLLPEEMVLIVSGQINSVAYQKLQFYLQY